MENSLAIISDAVWFTPALCVLLALTALLWEVGRQRLRLPACPTGPRPPGESARLNLDNLSETLVARLLFTIGFAVLAGLAANAAAKGSNSPLVYAVMFTGSCIALGLTLWTWRVVTRWSRCNLSFEGERRVGRQLNLLMLDGCRVFHDLADPAVGNIDHIIVAPHAVFAVETLTLRKAATPPADPQNLVISNGRELRFPTFTTSQPLKQAARNAAWLQKYLAKTTGVGLPVHPLLTIPGWTVQRTENGRVTVVSPEEIASVVVDKAASPLYEAMRLRIINLLDEKCQ